MSGRTIASGNSSETFSTKDGVHTASQSWNAATAVLNPNEHQDVFKGKYIYNGAENSVIAHTESIVQQSVYITHRLIKIYLDREAAVAGSLSAIVSSLCEDAGLLPSDYDVSDLNGIAVSGYVVSRTMSLRSAMEPLATAFFFDVFESDGILKFKRRGANAVETINGDFLLLKNDTGSRVDERRAMEVELPSRVSVVYADKESDFQQGSQNAQRIATTNSSRNSISIELPMSLGSDEARQISQKLLASAWNGRTTLDFSTTLDFLKLDPTDVVNVVLDDGTTFLIRLTDLEVGADYSLTVRGVSEYAASYVSSIDGGASEGFKPQFARKDIGTVSILPDMPLLRDADDTNGTASRAYSFTSGYSAENWAGASAYRSNDNGSSWTSIVSNNKTLPWGQSVNALPAPASPFKTDEDNSLTVYMEAHEDQLESITQLQMLNNSNAALLLTSDGKPEIIQFRDVTFNADSTVTLSGLLRGRRGTDPFCGDHREGDTFVLLNNSSGEQFSLDLSDLNDVLDLKIVANGQSFDVAIDLDKTYTGRDMMPYAPVNFSANLEADNSLTLNWFRRTRIGGEFENFVGDVPVSEISELYDVEILDGPDGAILRSYSGLTSATATYPAADYASDFPSGSNVLTFSVYQISEVVGRGCRGQYTIEVL